ncbi:MAG: hypothetical protein DMD79_15385, partial [Candidatus Rokuibacteriota bacterium]
MSGLLNSGSLGTFGELIANAGLVAKVVLLVLFFLSVVCWAIIFHKVVQFRGVNRESSRLLKVYRE